MIDHLRAMAIFAKVAEMGSFRAAAKALKLSPSVISHHISQLEERLDTALLYRSTRKISLTDAGTQLFEASENMLDAAQTGLNAIQKQTDQPTGRLSLAVTGAVFENPPFVDHLAGFAKRYPKIAFSISFSDQKKDLIGSSFDAAIRVGWLEDSQYKSRKLCEIERVLVTAPAYLADKPMPKLIHDLEAWDWVKLAQVPINRQLTNTAGDTPQFAPHIAIEVDSVAALVQMALNAMGVASVPRSTVNDYLLDGRLIALSPDWDLMAPGAYLVWPNNAANESLTRRFVDFMVDAMSTAGRQ